MKNGTKLFGIFILIVTISSAILIFLQSNRTRNEVDFATKQRKAIKSIPQKNSNKTIKSDFQDPNLSFTFRVADGAALLTASHLVALSFVGEKKDFDSVALSAEMEKQKLVPPGMAFLPPSEDFPSGLFVSDREDGFFILRTRSNSGVVEVLCFPRVPGRDGEPALIRFPEFFGNKVQAGLFIAPNCSVQIPPFGIEADRLQKMGWFVAPFNPDEKSEIEIVAAGLWRAKQPVDPR